MRLGLVISLVFASLYASWFSADCQPVIPIGAGSETMLARFFGRLSKGLGIALLGAVSTFLPACRKRSNADHFGVGLHGRLIMAQNLKLRYRAD